MLTLKDIEDTLSRVKFRDWQIRVHVRNMTWNDHDSRLQMHFLQVVFFEKNNDDPNGPVEEQRCRWWLIDTDKGPDEVVRTAYKAIEAAVRHEMDEQFLVDGVRVMDPHRKLI